MLTRLLVHGVPPLPADPLVVVPLQLRHDLVESVYLVPVSAGHQSPVLKENKTPQFQKEDISTDRQGAAVSIFT